MTPVMRPVLITILLGISPAFTCVAPADEVSSTLPWSIGSPTADEQYYLELINRARANPVAEAVRLAAATDQDIKNHYAGYGVDLALMQSEFSVLPPRPPLAMNGALTNAARGHSLDEFTNSFQDHLGSDGRYIDRRLTDAGYAWADFAENTYIYSKSTWFGHVSFEVDWGPGGAGGMLDGRKHRASIHSGQFKEVGIGIFEGSKGSGASAIGPQVITQDFALPAGPARPFVCGVAYHDFNGNAFYDPGEGIGGVTVTVSGADYHAVTASSGGYSIPAPAGDSVRSVSFRGLGFDETASAVITGTDNVKVDLKPIYAAPVVSGPPGPAQGIDNIYAVSTVGGALRHDWRVLRKGAAAAAAADNANDLARVITDTSPGYAVLSTTVKQQGTGSWHLAQPAGRAETITFRATFLGGSSPSIRYQSRLRKASAQQSALVEVSTDRGATWTTVETQTGTGDGSSGGQSSFSQRTVALTPVAAAKEFLLRFRFTVSGAPVNNSTADDAGWYIDAVSFVDITDVGVVTALPAGGNLFSFVPPATGAWLLSARAVFPGRTMAFGPATEVNAGTTPPVPSFALWSAGFELAAVLRGGTLSGAPGADYNSDGVANLMAYALGLSPVTPSADRLPKASSMPGTLILDYPRDTGKSDVTLTPQVSTDLQTWHAPGGAGAPPGFTDSLLSTNGAVQSRRAAVPAGPSKAYYLRLRVTKP